MLLLEKHIKNKDNLPYTSRYDYPQDHTFTGVVLICRYSPSQILLPIEFKLFRFIYVCHFVTGCSPLQGIENLNFWRTSQVGELELILLITCIQSKNYLIVRCSKILMGSIHFSMIAVLPANSQGLGIKSSCVAGCSFGLLVLFI